MIYRQFTFKLVLLNIKKFSLLRTFILFKPISEAAFRSITGPLRSIIGPLRFIAGQFISSKIGDMHMELLVGQTTTAA